VETDVREKAKRLNAPRHCSILPVLIHANEVTEGVRHGDTFARVVDFSRTLNAG
jgi:hypothetical protein